MDLEQIIKRLEWLDEERRKDKMTIATLEERIVALEGSSPATLQQIREIGTEVSRLNTMSARFDQIESTMAQFRVETARGIETIEKQRAEQSRETDKIRRADLESINKSVAEIRKNLEIIPEIKTNLQARVEEDYRLSRMIDETDHKISEERRSDEEYRRSQRLLEEGRRQDAKRLTDIQAEIIAMRKRQEEQRGKIDLTLEGIRKNEIRTNELAAAEGERRQAQTSFFEKQTLMMVERERTWKEWQAKFDSIGSQAELLETQMHALDTTHRSVKRAQEAFEEITQKFERRVNEITEMQRLNEDRFRQDWGTYKSDDQKRWANYSLIQEEQSREAARQFEKSNGRLTTLETNTQQILDSLQSIHEETRKQLQTLLTITHEWVESYERSLGNLR